MNARAMRARLITPSSIARPLKDQSSEPCPCILLSNRNDHHWRGCTFFRKASGKTEGNNKSASPPACTWIVYPSRLLYVRTRLASLGQIVVVPRPASLTPIEVVAVQSCRLRIDLAVRGRREHHRNVPASAPRASETLRDPCEGKISSTGADQRFMSSSCLNPHVRLCFIPSRPS